MVQLYNNKQTSNVVLTLTRTQSVKSPARKKGPDWVCRNKKCEQHNKGLESQCTNCKWSAAPPSSHNRQRQRQQ